MRGPLGGEPSGSMCLKHRSTSRGGKAARQREAGAASRVFVAKGLRVRDLGLEKSRDVSGVPACHRRMALTGHLGVVGPCAYL